MPTLPEGVSLQSSTSTSTSTPSSGRSTTASRPFGPGELIATFGDRCDIVIPDSPHLDQTCNHCLRVSHSHSPSSTTVKLRACTGCRVVVYCTTACQKADWAAVHSRECKVFRRVRAEGHDFLPTPVRALVQVLLRPETAVAVGELEGHAEAFRRGGDGDGRAWRDMELQALAALHYVGREASPRSVAGAVEVLCKLQVNSFNRLDADVGQTGLFINPALAMVNHSCIPNAFVQFIGRRAVLHAYQEIKKDEEIKISYIESTLLRSHRQEALRTRYHFDCNCPRCEEDLDIYQVCQRYPHLELNAFSLVPELDKFQEPLIDRSFIVKKALQRHLEDIYPGCSAPLQGTDSSTKLKLIRQRWRTCEQLRKAGMFAMEPLNQVLVESVVYFGENGKFACGLAVSCFLALNSDPYRGPMPFAPQRVKGMLMVAKLLANTAPANMVSGTDAVAGPLATNISEALSKMDQATICQVVLILVVRYSPAAHSKEWQVYQEAMDLLNDLEALPGRDTEQALVAAFTRNPQGTEERRFFESAVVKPMQKLADFAREVMTIEFGP